MSKHKLEDLTLYLQLLKNGKIGTPNKKTSKK